MWACLGDRVAAMASIHEPNDEDIQGFIAITSAPHSRAILYLKVQLSETFEPRPG